MAMRLSLFMLGICVVIVGIGNRAEAQNYPWCAIYSGTGGENCGFTTLEQCMETARMPTEYAVRSSTRTTSVE